VALPPEPIESMLLDAKVVVVGEVDAVVETGPALPQREGKKGERDLQNQAPWQRVTIRVDRCLRGDVAVGASLSALKPAGAYVVDAGTKGSFLLGAEADGVAPILGRYGPDTWRLEVVERAFSTPVP